MPKVEFRNKTIEVPEGSNLRKVLRKEGLSPHNGLADSLNCKGLGTCGTCAIEVEGKDLPPMNGREKWRLNFPPHQLDSGLRLACQLKVNGDLKLRKHPGFWGEKGPRN